LQSYRQVLAEAQTIDSGSDAEMVRRRRQPADVARPVRAGVITIGRSHLSRRTGRMPSVFRRPKLSFYTGNSTHRLRDEAGLATVLVMRWRMPLRRHGAQRVLQQNLAQTAMTGIAVSLSDMDYDKTTRGHGRARRRGAQFGVLMPFGPRT
jgi:hypothetical protein